MADEPPWVGGCHGAGLIGDYFPGVHKGQVEGPKCSAEGPVHLEGKPEAALHLDLESVLANLMTTECRVPRPAVQPQLVQIPASHQVKTNGVKVAMWGTQPQNYRAVGAFGPHSARRLLVCGREYGLQLWAHQCSTVAFRDPS